jgi:hypothetical protein
MAYEPQRGPPKFFQKPYHMDQIFRRPENQGAMPGKDLFKILTDALREVDKRLIALEGEGQQRGQGGTAPTSI